MLALPMSVPNQDFHPYTVGIRGSRAWRPDKVASVTLRAVGDPTTPLKAGSPVTRSRASVHGSVRDPDCSYYPPPGETGRARPDATVGEPGVISIRRISLGGGYRYLMDSVAVGDGAAERSNGLTRYYGSSGTPPGVFLGEGLAELDGGRGVEAGSQVTEEHLEAMLAGMTDPITSEPLGSTPRAPRGGVPVAGFDLTFSPSKSVSVVWAVADEGTKAVIYECHRRAVEFVIGWAETEVFCTRSGTNGIVEEDVTGEVAAAFTHWTSPADDPQLHDHVVIWNRARSVSDGKWRTLDSRSIFKATTTLAELHQGVLSDLLTEALGVGWQALGRRHSTKARYEIDGVPEALMAQFSKRVGQIAEHTEHLRAAFAAAHGRAVTAVEDMRLHQQATLATRPDKNHRSLAELTDSWREEAAGHVGAEQVAWVTSLKDRNDLPLLRADDLADPILADAAEAVLASVSERHAAYGRQNLLAEAHRVLHGVRFATPDDRVAVAERVTTPAVGRSLVLTPPTMCHTLTRYLRADRTPGCDPRVGSRIRPRICSTPRPGCSLPAGPPTGRWSGSQPWQRSPRRTCPAGTTPRAPTRRSPSRRSPPPGGSSTCSSARPGPARPPPWRRYAPHGRQSTGRDRWSASPRPPQQPRSSVTSSASAPRTPPNGSPSGGASLSSRPDGTTSPPSSPDTLIPSPPGAGSCATDWRWPNEPSRNATCGQASW